MPDFIKISNLASTAKLAFLGLTVLGITFTSCKREGCTDVNATNYDEKAKTDDGSCEFDESANVELVFNLKNGSQDLALNESFSHDSGLTVRLSVFKFYITDPKLSGNGIEANDDYTHFVDFNTEEPSREDIPKWTNTVSFFAEAGDYTELTFGIGVNSEENEAYTPNSYPLDNPLNVTYNFMGWGWADKYKFIVIEGDIDADGDGTFEDKFFAHTGFNEMYREVTYPISISVANGSVATVAFDLDIVKVLNQMDVANLKSHSEGSEQMNASIKFTDAFVDALTIK